ncbi:hypothetical protein FRB90_008516, partial [Tulasnella sp. 427]
AAQLRRYFPTPIQQLRPSDSEPPSWPVSTSFLTKKMDPPNYYSPVPVYAGPMIMPHQHFNYIEVAQPHPQPVIPRQIVYIPAQIHPAGILPPSTLGLSLLARLSCTTANIGDVMSYLQPAFQRLLRTNLPYIRRETRDKPLIHPTYPQKIHDIMQMVQAHRQPEGGLHPLAAGDEIM